MRHSALKHSLAVLRKQTGLKQPAFAQLVGCSPSTIAQIETNQLALSEELARRIETQTDVSLSWLMRNDLEQPIMDRRDRPYTLQSFEARRAEIATPFGARKYDRIGARYAMGCLSGRMLSLFTSAVRRGAHSLCLYRLRTAIEAAEKEFGTTPEIHAAIANYEDKIDTVLPDGMQPGVFEEQAMFDEFDKCLRAAILRAYPKQPSPSKQPSHRQPAARSKTKR